MGKTIDDAERRSFRWLVHWLGLIVFSAILATVLGCQPAGAGAQTPPSEGIVVNVDQLPAKLEEIWASRTKSGDVNGRPTFWNPAYSPYMAGEWPPTPTTTWTRYAYAYGQDPGLSDGLRVAYPWAKVERVAGASTATIIVLGDSIDPYSTQGVRPADPATIAALNSQPSVESYVFGLTGLPDPMAPETILMANFYRSWRANHGAIAKELVPLHADFWVWVG